MKKRLIFGVMPLFLFLILFFPGTFFALRFFANEEAQYYKSTGPDYYKPYDAYHYHFWGYDQVPRVRPSSVCNSVYGHRVNCGNDYSYNSFFFTYSN